MQRHSAPFSPPFPLRSPRLAAVLAVVLTVTGCSSISTSSSSRQAKLTALDKPAEVLIDQWGVPHIYAASTYDAFVAQGYMAARDRLWQMDLWRKRGLGEMAADFGASWVDSDKAARAVLFRGDRRGLLPPAGLISCAGRPRA